MFENSLLLKQLIAYILFFFTAFSAEAQYYLRGEVTDEKGIALQRVKILLHSSRQLFYTGPSGGFGITTHVLYDSLTLSMEGFDSKTVRVKSDIWQNITLKVLPSNANKNRPKLISVTKNLNQTSRVKWYIDNETYFQLVENDYVNADKYPNTGFSLNVNKASYSNVRRFINMQSAVPPDAVRMEEMINYFNLHYREPEGADLFRLESQLTSCPWDMEKALLVVNVNARKVDLSRIPPSNFVFLIDASGSMDMPNKLPLLKAAFQLFVKNQRPIDTISIVTYGGTVGIWPQPTSGAEKEKITKSIEELTAIGDTPGQSAIMAAYTLANKTFIKGGSNRVILATDGDFNVGAASEKELEELITKERQSGVYLTCLGVGMGNFKDSKLETLAKKGNGNYAYIDDLKEAEKVLVKELTQTFYAVADDVFMNIQFNPKLIKEYRLIGFDNRRDAVADSTIDLEGGELGSGNSVLAYFEIVPGSDQLFKDTGPSGEKLATIDLRYSLCNDTAHLRFSWDCPANFTDFKSIDKELQFATAVAMFGLKVKQSKYIRNAEWIDIHNIAQASYDPNVFLQAEFLQLVDKAEAIYSRKKKKKSKSDD